MSLETCTSCGRDIETDEDDTGIYLKTSHACGMCYERLVCGACYERDRLAALEEDHWEFLRDE